MNKVTKIGIAAGLAQATSALLAMPTLAKDHGWDIDTAILYYSEADRVSAAEPMISATKKLENDRQWNMKLVVDALTGSSPSGATPYDQVQTFTSPSGKSTYQTTANEIPLDPSFRDTRVALSSQYVTPFSNTLKFSGGVAFSTEHDYQSIGANGNLAQDFNQHNTTLSLGVALASDTINPEGGAPVPLGGMLGIGESRNKRATDSKTVTDFLLGLTQVISPTWLIQANYSLSQQSGYLNDPYKIVSWLDDSGRPVNYHYEARPDSRTKNSFFIQSKSHHGKDNVLDLSYRYHTDDWGINSHTLDASFRWQLNTHHYIAPHARYYQQAAADFYTQGLLASAGLPEFASADSRLGEFTGITLGAKYGYMFNDDQEINLRIESYNQSGIEESLPGGIEAKYDTFPDLSTVLVQLGYRFTF